MCYDVATFESHWERERERVMILNVISNRLINISTFVKVVTGGWGNA
ncbi:MAG: hypothetical protein ACTS4X_00290 [Candidatus Hodgkinia cicadicola]